MAVRPLRQVRLLGQRLGASRQKGPQREHQYLIQTGRRVARGARAPLGAHTRRVVVPLPDQRLKGIAFAAERHDFLVVAAFERFVPMEDVGSLTKNEAEIAPLE